MPQKLTIGFSPCPNDTFIFDAMVHQKINTNGITCDYVLEDVETLNEWALQGRLPITKLSYNTFLQVADKYILLDSGSALGKGVGPILITKNPLPEGQNLEQYLTNASIAIPGFNTTANLLFSLAFPQAKNKTAVLFSEIEQVVLNGDYDCGLVIHESRFTYATKGLLQLIDMGNWWEQTSGAAIPLGGICVRNDIDTKTIKLINDTIKLSLHYSWDNYPNLASFVTENAQEMSEDVMRQHINLYVNDYSTSLGIDGRNAVKTLFALAEKAGINTCTIDNTQIFLNQHTN